MKPSDDPSCPKFSPFRGGLILKSVKIILLAVFLYGAVSIIAFGINDRVVRILAFAAGALLGAISLKESFQHTNDVSRWLKSRIDAQKSK